MASEETYDERSAIRHAYNDSGTLGTPPNETQRSLLQQVPKRYIVAIMAFLGFMNVYMLRVNLSVAIVGMTRGPVDQNGTRQAGELDWDTRTQGLVLSSFFWGYIVTQLPGGWLATRIGGKYLYGGGILGTGLMTLLSPPSARASVYFFIVVRIIEGLFEGVTYPAIHSLWAKWAPPLERTKLTTTALSGAYMGTVVALPLSGKLVDSLGWPSVFYITGLLAIVWFLAWCYLVVESPSDHSTISHTELDYINRSIGFSQQQTQGSDIPWRYILTSSPVWAIAAAHFAENWGFYTLLTELPSFLSDVTAFQLTMSGFAAALPYLAMALMIMLGGQLADIIRSRGILSTTSTRKIFTSGAFLWQTGFMLVTAYMTNPTSIIACITVAVGVGGFVWSGFGVNHLDLAPQYAGILMGISNTLATIPGIISPSLTGFLTQHHTHLEWRVVFFIASTIYCLGALVYVLLASGERQLWAQIPEGYEQHLDTHSEVVGPDECTTQD